MRSTSFVAFHLIRLHWKISPDVTQTKFKLAFTCRSNCLIIWNKKSIIFLFQLCERAQLWANHLANLNELYYCGRNFNFGQNIFCCPETALLIDLTGQEVATYWYTSLKRYNFYKDPELLHTNVNAGHFTQIVWKNTKYFGVGKASSHTGKVFVVALYFPPGKFFYDVFFIFLDSTDFTSW